MVFEKIMAMFESTNMGNVFGKYVITKTTKSTLKDTGKNSKLKVKSEHNLKSIVLAD